MIRKIYYITLNHYKSALEHIEKNHINHTPTIFEAFRVTIYDFLFNKTIFDKTTKSHLVYEIIKNPTLGIRVANVIRIYVPEHHRGKGIVSKMLDKIPEKIVISGEGKHGEVGRLFVSRINI